MVCIEKQMKDSMFEEVKEVMYNEEFRAIIRRNLFALDQGDVAVELASDICSSIDRRNKPKFEPIRSWVSWMKNAGNVFLLGASGMGMAPLAIYLQGSGLSVEAYDDHFCEPLRKMMQDEGIQVLHEPNPIETPDYSNPIKCYWKNTNWFVHGFQRKFRLFEGAISSVTFLRTRKSLQLLGVMGRPPLPVCLYGP